MIHSIHSRRALWLGLVVSLGLITALFSACTDLVVPAVTPTPTRTPQPTLTPTPTPTPTPAWPLSVNVSEELPAPVAEAVNTVLAEHPDLFISLQDANAADIYIESGGDGTAPLFAHWVYAVVTPFPALIDEVAWADVDACWSGAAAGPFGGQPLLMTEDTARTLRGLLGDPAAGAVEIVESEEALVQRAWDTRPAWAIVPFDRLEPRWKVLPVDGTSVLDKDFDASTYPLAASFGLAGREHGVARLGELVGAPLVNRDPARMTVLMMTGVTALGRCTADRMDRYGVLYPARDIRPWLIEPDITHISNEVSFAGNCSQACIDSVVFCAKPHYIELFEDLDIDVIELTGNHLLDWGMGAMELSLQMYDERAWTYYGGGWNVVQAQQPLEITHGMHTFGFIGCNPVGPDYDWATADSAGSAPCNYGWMHTQIRQMRERGVIPIVTLQYWEFDRFEPTPQQMADFRGMVDAGAVIVSGSQAHHPQTFEFYNGTFIHYGLGNLFFDQMQWIEYRREFMDRHVFYDGRHISTGVFTALLEDYARPRPMTAVEREAFLAEVFRASGW